MTPEARELGRLATQAVQEARETFVLQATGDLPMTDVALDEIINRAVAPLRTRLATYPPELAVQLWPEMVRLMLLEVLRAGR